MARCGRMPVLNDTSLNLESSFWPLLERSFDGIVLFAPNPWRVAYANPVVARWFGTTSEQLVGRSVGDLFDPKSSSAVLEQVERGLSIVATLSLLVDLQTKTGDGRSAVARLCHTSLDDAPLVGVILRATNAGVAAETVAERRDPLTGLLDRDFLEWRLTSLLRGGRLADRRFAVLFIDLDNFKDVNDRHGHLIGDRVLREAARRLAGSVRDGDHVVRYGGDEFVVLVEQVAAPAELQAIIGRIKAEIAKPIAVPEGDVTLSVSVGLALAAPEYRTPDELLAAADQAMYAAKRDAP